MSNLKDHLARLGLAQYFEVLAAEGFDTWDTVLDITESDLSQLGVKLGHRRKLQRAIAETRGQTSDRPLPNALPRSASVEEPYRSEDSGTEGKGKQSEAASPAVPRTAVKRKYRRHPRPDEYAPERPPSAYVIFSNHIRESLRGQDLSFTEIAKIVGERWQVLPADARENCERQANNAKERYYAELAKYKKTPQYIAYQRYLEDFKIKNSIPTKGKRSKLETETSTSTRSSSHEKQDRLTHRRSSPAPPDLSGIVLHKRDSTTPPIGPMRLPAGPSFSSKPSSPATLSFSGYNSPRLADPFSPITTSPRSAGFPKETLDTSANAARERKIAADTNLPYGSFADHHRYSASKTPPSYPRGPSYTTPLEPSSRRRPIRESVQLPHLTHEDTTLSSISSNSGYNVFLGSNPTPVLPMESAKTLRILPQPVPTTGSSTSSLDRPPASQQQSPFHVTHPQIQSSPRDFRTEGPLAVLVRAGELVSRETQPEPMEEDGNE